MVNQWSFVVWPLQTYGPCGHDRVRSGWSARAQSQPAEPPNDNWQL